MFVGGVDAIEAVELICMMFTQRMCKGLYNSPVDASAFIRVATERKTHPTTKNKDWLEISAQKPSTTLRTYH
jgi:hypothetical protein